MAFSTRLLSYFEGVGIALDSLRANKVRAGLTIFGVAIGVFVVVTMSAMVKGINESVARDLEAAGPSSFFIFRRPVQMMTICDGTDETCPWRRNPGLTVAEAEMLEGLPSVQAVTAHVASGASYRYKDRELPQAGLDGYTANWTDVDGGDIFPGRSFTRAEADNAARVIIINEKMAETLFGDIDPLDKYVQVNGIPFQVIGLYHYTASFLGSPNSSAQGDSPKAIMPLESARRYIKVWMRGMDLTVKPREGVPQIQAIDDVTAALRADRRLRPSQDNTFAITTQERLMEVYNGFFGTFFIVMIGLSAVGLMVGGVGVVAIMMISVTERTREIGVRKALGATRGTILWQFLVEAATLTSIGATLGLLLGALVAVVIRSATPVPAEIPAGSIVAALVASALTGVLFGMLPAIRASRLDPVAALRYE
jgi:putative ABC transport system permease protein